jgi:hypothetical protein
MAETLGSLCDKLTIVRLKQWHTNDRKRLASLAGQLRDLQAEIDDFVARAVAGEIAFSRLKFAANKVYAEKRHVVGDVAGQLGEVFAKLAEVNCALWHQQEKIYDFEKVPAAKKNGIIKRLAGLNLERNRCIETIDECFRVRLAAAPARPRPPGKTTPAACRRPPGR